MRTATTIKRINVKRGTSKHAVLGAKGHRTLWVIGLCWVLTVTLASGQTQPTAPVLKQAPQRGLPMSTLYRFFLAFQLHLERTADALDKKGENGTALRTHYQKQLGFSAAEFNPVHDAAVSLEAKLKEQDAKARAVIDKIHEQYPPGKVKGPEDLPPPSPELAQLQEERNALIRDEVNRLKASLGTEKAAKLDKFLQAQFAPTLKVQSVTPAPSRHPVQRTTKPFPQEVQP
jgi:hypothetical protein